MSIIELLSYFSCFNEGRVKLKFVDKCCHCTATVKQGLEDASSISYTVKVKLLRYV